MEYRPIPILFSGILATGPRTFAICFPFGLLANFAVIFSVDNKDVQGFLTGDHNDTFNKEMDLIAEVRTGFA